MNRQTGLLLFYKPDNTVYEIYDVTYDSAGFPHFLFYREGEWLRKSAKYFTPNYYEDEAGHAVCFDM